MRRVDKIIRKINVVHLLCDQLFDEQHTHRHRVTIGIVVMCVGVSIAKGSAFFEFEAIRFIGDGIGYLIHGLGVVPIIDLLNERARANAHAQNQANKGNQDDA